MGMTKEQAERHRRLEANADGFAAMAAMIRLVTSPQYKELPNPTHTRETALADLDALIRSCGYKSDPVALLERRAKGKKGCGCHRVVKDGNATIIERDRRCPVHGDGKVLPLGRRRGRHAR